MFAYKCKKRLTLLMLMACAKHDSLELTLA